MSQETVVTIEKFSGLNKESPPAAIEDSELSHCVNFEIGKGGELSKRTGWKQAHDGSTLGAESVSLLGIYKTSTIEQFIARAGNNIYFSVDAITWTLIPGGPWGDVDYGVQYIDKFYMVRGNNTVIEWDGAVATAIAGSPSGNFCRVHKDRLFVLDTDGAFPSRLYFSKIADFSSTGWVSTNFIDISPGGGDLLIGAINIQEHFYIFKSQSIWTLIIQGTPENWVVRNFTKETGCVSKYTPREVEGTIFFLGNRGVYMTDGVSLRRISRPLDSYFKKQLTDAPRLNRASAFYWEHKYVVSVEVIEELQTWQLWQQYTWEELQKSSWESGTRFHYFAYYIDIDGWTEWEPAEQVSPHNFVESILSPITRGVFSGERGLTGRVLKYGDTIYTDVGFNYLATLSTKRFDFDSPIEFKRGKWLGVKHRNPGGFTLTNFINGNQKKVYSLFSSHDTSLTKAPGPGYFTSWMLVYEALHNDAVVFYGVSMPIHKKRQVIKSGT